MKVKIQILINKEELNRDYGNDYIELNGELPSFEEIKEAYIDMFIANKNDYIDSDEIDVIIEDKGKIK